MQISIKQEFLMALLDRALTISRSEMAPLLRSFLIEVDESGVFRIVRTDSQLAAVASTKAFEWDSEPLRVVVNADKLHNLVKSLSGDAVSLKVVSPTDLEIICGSYRANWRLFDIANYPVLPSFDSKKFFVEVDSSMFISLIDRVRYAAAVSTFRPEWRQLYFDKGLCWAMDGSRYQEVVSELSPDLFFALPLIACDVVKMVRLSGTQIVTMETDETYYYFRIGSDLFISINPKIPPPVNPKEAVFGALNRRDVGWFTVEVAVLKEILRRIGITSRKGDNRVRIAVKSKNVTFSSTDDDGNRSSEDLIITFNGSSLQLRTVDIQWDWLFDALSVVKAPVADLLIGPGHIGVQSEDSFGIVPMLKGEV
jgi:DNA polymerase III sliding clamp (beta) subunit (PCNA family)